MLQNLAMHSVCVEFHRFTTPSRVCTDQFQKSH